MIRQFGIQKPTGKNLLIIHTQRTLAMLLGRKPNTKNTHNWFSTFGTSFEYDDMAMRENIRCF